MTRVIYQTHLFMSILYGLSNQIFFHKKGPQGPSIDISLLSFLFVPFRVTPLGLVDLPIVSFFAPQALFILHRSKLAT
ncbi:hypothetical protein D3C85_88310 [compost metagenome]